jgi:transposase InsO family protein
VGSRMTAQVVCDALRMAIWQRRPKAGLILLVIGFSTKSLRQLSWYYTYLIHAL